MNFSVRVLFDVEKVFVVIPRVSIQYRTNFIFTNYYSMSFSLDKFSMNVGCKHPSTTLRVPVRLSVVEVCFR
jgi:hypothetical protein